MRSQIKYLGAIFVLITCQLALNFRYAEFTSFLRPTLKSAKQVYKRFAVASVEPQVTAGQFAEECADIYQQLSSLSLPYNSTSLDALLPVKGGTPVRSVIVSTWRSGSTFLGDIVASRPGNWYHYEPLLLTDDPRFNISDQMKVNHLKSLLNCNYRHMDNFVKQLKKNIEFSMSNSMLWKYWEQGKDVHWASEFFSSTCRMFPSQSMKTVRLRLQLAQQLLQDPGLNVRMVYLVRDPRGIVNSRLRAKWCKNRNACMNVETLCADLVSNYHAAVLMSQAYTTTFRVIRYEELSVQPLETSLQLLKFFGIQNYPQLRDYLNAQKQQIRNGDTRQERTFHWQEDMDFDTAEHVQNTCREAMDLWGYLPAHNQSHLRTFDSVTSYRLK